MSEIFAKLKEVLTSVLPVTAIVLILNFTFTPLDSGQLPRFLIGAVLVIVGLTIFLLGIDQSIEPIGHAMGGSLAKSKALPIVITISLTLGFFISYAEPDLHILAGQVDAVTQGQFGGVLMVIVVSIGLAVMMTLGLLRILSAVRLRYVFTFAYALIMILSFFSPPDFIAIAFDSSGATTGAITVPFMLALAGGVAALKRDSKAAEADSFGLVGIASSGAIIGVLVTGLIMGVEKLEGTLPESQAISSSLLDGYFGALSQLAFETFISLLPILLAYLLFNIIALRQRKREIWSNIRGLIITYVGLVTFMLGVNGGFMDVGTQIGASLANLDSKIPVLIIALVLGLVTVLAEPAVHVLTHQVEDVTGGHVRRPLVLGFLSAAVGLAIFMSVLRILVPGIELWMYLLPGFGLSVLLAYFVPDLFVGTAFDAGGVASGPMTATFSLAFVQGIAAQIPTADVVTDGFGMIAIVAMMPIISVQLLGAIYQSKTRKLRSQKGKEND
ncbi:MAG: DUF1538 domain-containing protein [Fastidiosipilaceae bacterium]